MLTRVAVASSVVLEHIIDTWENELCIAQYVRGQTACGLWELISVATGAKQAENETIAPFMLHDTW